MRDKYQQAKFERYSEQLGYGDFEEGEPDDDGRTRYRNPNTQGRWNFWVASRDALALQPSASAEPVQAEAIARRFHEAYERLAPSFGYTTRQDTREWSPESTNGQLMIAVCEDLFASPVTAAPEQEASATGAERIVIREDRFSEHRDTRKVPQHHGYCFGVTVTPRKDAGDLVELFVEDDEFWHFVTAFDVHWLPELTRVLGLATPTTSTTGKVDASRVRDEALEEAAKRIESHKKGSINDVVMQAFADDVRSLIGTPKSAEGEGA